MRKFITITLLAILGVALGQNCPDIQNNTTDPDNPQYNHPDPDIVDRYINLRNGDPRFNWLEDGLRYDKEGTNVDPPDFCDVDNPFVTIRNDENVDWLFDYDLTKRDNLPSQGWELIVYDFGLKLDGTYSNVEHPHFILYNKYRGTLRVFYYLKEANFVGHEYDVASVKLSFWGGDEGKQPSILNHMEEVPKPLDFYNKGQSEQTSNALDNGQGSDLCDGMWMYADFVMAYDPCVCDYKYDRLRVEIMAVNTADLKLTGDLSTSPLTKSPTISPNPPNGSANTTSPYKTAYKQVGKFGKEAKTYYKKGKDFRDLLVNMADATPPKKKNEILEYSKFAKDIPYLGAAIGLVNLFLMEEEKEDKPSAQSVSFNATVNITGSIDDYGSSEEVVFHVPGSDFGIASSNTKQNEVPLYNEPLGVVSLLKTPRIEFSHSRPQHVNGDGNFQPFAPLIGLPVVTEYSIEDDLELVVNPSSELELTEVKASVVLTYNVNPLKSFENGLLPTELLNYPYVPGATFDVLATATGGFPAITLNVGGYANDDWELLEKSNANLELIVSDELYKVSYGQAPITCFSNTNFYLISAEEPTVELLPHIAIRLNITMKHPVTQINYKFVQSYDVDKSQMFEVDRGLQFYGIDGQALIDLEESEPLTQQLIPLRLLPIVGPGTGNNIFQTSKNIPDFRFFENETIGGFVDAWDGIIIGDNVTIEPGTWITAGRYIDVQSENNYLGEVHMQIGIRDQTCLDNPNNFVSTGSDLSTFCDGSATIKYDPVYSKRTEIVESEEVVARSLDFSLYPNPTDNLANINLPELEAGTYTLTVLDLRGMTVFSETRAYAISGEQTFSIGTADYTSGVYFVTLSQGDLTKTKKLVIAK